MRNRETMKRLCEKILRISSGEPISFDQLFLAEDLETMYREACKKGSKALVVSAGTDPELCASLLYYLVRLKEQKHFGNSEIVLDAAGILSQDAIPMLLHPEFPISDGPVYKDGYRILKKNERGEFFQGSGTRQTISDGIQEVQIIVTVS